MSRRMSSFLINIIQRHHDVSSRAKKPFEPTRPGRDKVTRRSEAKQSDIGAIGAIHMMHVCLTAYRKRAVSNSVIRYRLSLPAKHNTSRAQHRLGQIMWHHRYNFTTLLLIKIWILQHASNRFPFLLFTNAFIIRPVVVLRSEQTIGPLCVATSTQVSEDAQPHSHVAVPPPCLYRGHDHRWRQRIELDKIALGQKLVGVAIEGAELLEAKTGPKSKYLAASPLIVNRLSISAFYLKHLYCVSFL